MMPINLEALLSEKFGYTSFRPGQKEAIESVLGNKDTLVLLPTGTGKSLCYQLPSYLFEGTTLIVSPLLSLMQDQVESLKLTGEKRVVAVNSLTPASVRHKMYKNLNHYKFIYTSPEMLQNKEFFHYLKHLTISLFVVDEAHCVSHWGTDFRPDYLALSKIKEQLNSPVTMALTATATPRVRKEIMYFLGMNPHDTQQVIQSVDRPEIKFIVEQCTGNKLEKAIQYVKEIRGPGIIYFTSKKLADETSLLLRTKYNVLSESYHSDIEADDKIKIQQQFLKNKIQVICATSAFGMGFDKEDIRYVIHFHLPDSPEMYLQEVGRASRDRKEGLAILLYQSGDELIQRRFLEDSLPSKEIMNLVASNESNMESIEKSTVKLARYYIDAHSNFDEALQSISKRKQAKHRQIDYMVSYISTQRCKRQYLLEYFNESKSENMKYCCSSCDTDFDEFIDDLNQTQIDMWSKNDKEESWQETIQKLYNMH